MKKSLVCHHHLAVVCVCRNQASLWKGLEVLVRCVLMYFVDHHCLMFCLWVCLLLHASLCFIICSGFVGGFYRWIDFPETLCLSSELSTSSCHWTVMLHSKTKGIWRVHTIQLWFSLDPSASFTALYPTSFQTANPNLIQHQHTSYNCSLMGFYLSRESAK